jgi:DNA-directed RNA polymerase subunit RPC12/RpoP
MKYSPKEARRVLLALRAEMLSYLQVREEDARFCVRCMLPLPEGEYDSYDFCPWCSKSQGGIEPRPDESRKIIERDELERRIGIQCGECGCEYEQPARYPYLFCAACGARFAIEDEVIVELPWLVS